MIVEDGLIEPQVAPSPGRSSHVTFLGRTPFRFSTEADRYLPSRIRTPATRHIDFHSCQTPSCSFSPPVTIISSFRSIISAPSKFCDHAPSNTGSWGAHGDQTIAYQLHRVSCARSIIGSHYIYYSMHSRTLTIFSPLLCSSLLRDHDQESKHQDFHTHKDYQNYEQEDNNH